MAPAYATAAAQVESVPAGPHESPLVLRLVRSLGRARDGYVLLGAALRAREHAGYLAAAKKIRAADAQAPRCAGSSGSGTPSAGSSVRLYIGAHISRTLRA
jgi:hypothetical protein